MDNAKLDGANLWAVCNNRHAGCKRKWVASLVALSWN